ncbi:hypothetical protein SAMN06297144_3337 [Sphingomonas guangdongensis]|uniref:EF hand n=1 Tax=Sphingomonas guangdongensis TaxID=1141890 RepID=A0A285R736_9SPHN|nr:EF-hand domain-containing protein [Sphingomonas guangdongensis]SOB88192.1 hypothetical protein SAMN06297144_3337 [Sphingomonas guangdongensis]
MLKMVMLVSALAISAPVMAEDTPVQSAPQTTSPAQPTNTDPAAAPTDAGTAATAAQATPTTDTAPAAPAQTGAAVTGASQIAQVVDTEFPTYDKNADSNLDKTEFGAWMVALKSASDPSTKATDPATKTWVNGAFASADTDKSKSVSKTELTTYLSQGQG